MLVKIKKISVAVVLCCLITLNIKSQELINLVPNNCIVSGMIDLKQIDAKANLSQIFKLPLMAKLDTKLFDFILGSTAIKDSNNVLNYKEIGIGTNNKSWFYLKMSEQLFYGAIIFPLENEPVFSAYVQKSVNSEDGVKIMNAGGYKYFNNHKLNVVWNNKFLAFYGASILPSMRDSLRKSMEPSDISEYYNDFHTDSAVVEDVEIPSDEVAPTEDQLEIFDEPEVKEGNQVADSSYVIAENIISDTDTTATPNYSDNSYYLSSEKVDEKCDSLVNFWCSTNASIFLKDNASLSISGNKTFMDYLKDNPDAAFMVDYGAIAELVGGANNLALSGMTTLTGFYGNYLKEYYKGLVMRGKARLNQDDLQLSYDVVHSEKMKTIYKEVKKNKISDKFLKYLGSDVMAYAAIGVDIPGYSKGFGNMLREIYPTIPTYGEIFGISMDLLDIVVDQQALYNIFTGDVVVALNGIKPVQVVHTAYDYDDNYNMTERMDTTTQMQPEVLFMAGIGNVDDVKKILKLSVASKVFSLENGLYSLTYKKADLPVFMKIQDEILFISNNKSFVENPVVLAKDKQLSMEHFKMFKKNTGVMFANTEKIAMEASSQGLSENKTVLVKSGNLFKSMKVTAGQKDGRSFGNFVLQLSKTNDNSLTDIFKFLNELFESKTSRFD